MSPVVLTHTEHRLLTAYHSSWARSNVRKLQGEVFVICTASTVDNDFVKDELPIEIYTVLKTRDTRCDESAVFVDNKTQYHRMVVEWKVLSALGLFSSRRSNSSWVPEFTVQHGVLSECALQLAQSVENRSPLSTEHLVIFVLFTFVSRYRLSLVIRWSVWVFRV